MASDSTPDSHFFSSASAEENSGLGPSDTFVKRTGIRGGQRCLNGCIVGQGFVSFDSGVGLGVQGRHIIDELGLGLGADLAGLFFQVFFGLERLLLIGHQTVHPKHDPIVNSSVLHERKLGLERMPLLGIVLDGLSLGGKLKLDAMAGPGFLIRLQFGLPQRCDPGHHSAIIRQQIKIADDSTSSGIEYAGARRRAAGRQTN